MKPIGDLCLIVIAPGSQEKVMPSGIVIPAVAMEHEARVGIVREVGQKVTTVKKMDRVILDPGAPMMTGQWTDDDDVSGMTSECCFAHETHIMAVLE